MSVCLKSLHHCHIGAKSQIASVEDLQFKGFLSFCARHGGEQSHRLWLSAESLT